MQAIDAVQGGADDAFVFTAVSCTGAFTDTAGEFRHFADGANTVVESDGSADFQIGPVGGVMLADADLIL